MSKKMILIIICLLVVTGCGQSNQLKINHSKIKDTLVYRKTIDEDSDFVYFEIVFNFDKDNKLISVNTINDYDYNKTPYNIEVLKKGIEEKTNKSKYCKANVTIKDKSQNILRFNYLTDIQKIREDLKNSDDKEKFYDDYYEKESYICNFLFPIDEDTEKYLEYGKEEWENLINSEFNEEEDSSNVKSPTIKTDGSYYSDSGSIMWVKFDENKEINISYDTGCTEDMPCGGYDEMGTYIIEGNKIIATMTHYYGIVETELDEIKKIEFTIINENQIETDTQVFNYR